MTPLDAIARLHTALTGLAKALESGHPDTVLEAERPLAEATVAIAAIDHSSLTGAVQLRARLLETRLALDRCRALGDSSAHMLEAIHPDRAAYERGGQKRLRVVGPRTVNSQV
jgi:hypothetical protein